MKRHLHLLVLLLALLTAAGCRDRHQEHAAGDQEYTCPMHPQIVQDQPGTCPICGMDLVPRSGTGADIPISEDLSFLLKPANSSVVADIAATRPQQKAQQATLRLEGLITYDPRQVYTVAARVGGRIERLYVKYNFQPIRKGQKLMELYSPELITAQQELIYLLRSAPEDQQLQEGAKQKLRFLGATSSQIKALIRSGKPDYTFTVFSPHDGYVTGLNTTAPGAAPPAGAGPAAAGAGAGMDAMGGGGAAASSPAAAGPAPVAAGPDLQLQEGMYVAAGQPLVRVVNPTQMWAEFKLAAQEAAHLAKGTPVLVSFPQLPGAQIKARVDFLQPFYQEGQDFATVRVYLPASHKGIMAGQLVSALATHTTGNTLWVPAAAVVDIGSSSVAFKKGQGVYAPVRVTTGVTQGQQVQIVAGLQPADSIAANAQYLVDSESFIKVKK